MASPQSFVKKTPWSDLRRLLSWAGTPVESLNDIDPKMRKEAFAEAVFSAIDGAGERVASEVFAAIDQIEQFRDDFGLKSLRSVAVASGIPPEEFDAHEDIRPAAIQLLTRNRRDFERAVASHYADRYRQGRSWSGFALGAPGEIELRKDAAAQEAFEAEALKLFAEDPLCGRCKFDWFERMVPDPWTGEEHRCRQATVYLEERPRSESKFDEDGEVIVETRRPVAEGAVVFDRGTGQVEVVAKGGRVLHERVATLFRETMIEGGAATEPVRMRRLGLQRLARPTPLDIRAEDGVVAAEVDRLTMVDSSESLTVTLASREGVIDEDDLHGRARADFADRSPIGRPGWRIVSASIRVVFAPDGPDKRPKTVRVTLSSPNRSNLRDQTERHRLIAGTLMKRWGLYASDEA